MTHTPNLSPTEHFRKCHVYKMLPKSPAIGAHQGPVTTYRKRYRGHILILPTESLIWKMSIHRAFNNTSTFSFWKILSTKNTYTHHPGLLIVNIFFYKLSPMLKYMLIFLVNSLKWHYRRHGFITSSFSMCLLMTQPLFYMVTVVKTRDTKAAACPVQDLYSDFCSEWKSLLWFWSFDQSATTPCWRTMNSISLLFVFSPFV